MKLTIDTNAYSELMRGNRVVIGLIESAEEIIVPPIVLGELFTGFYRGNRTEKNIEELDAFLEKPGVIIADINRSIAERYGFIVKYLKIQGTPIPTNDIWIAAIAMNTGSKLLTKDDHFENVPGIMLVSY